MTTPRKPRLRRAAVAVVCLIAIAALGEVVLQTIGFGHPALAVLNDATQYELMPNQHIRRLWPLSDSWVAHVDTNQFGMRSMPISSQKQPNVLRIYFLGDSITYGTTQVDQSQIFTDLVRRELPSIVHQPVEVMDGAMSGWAIPNELAYLKEYGTVNADRVVLVLNDDDPTQPLSPKPYNFDIPSAEFNPKWGYQELWERALKPRLHVFFREHGVHLLESETYQDPGTTVGGDDAILRQNLQYLDQMCAYTRQNGAAFSILFIPFGTRYDDPNLDKKVAEGRAAIRAWAERNQVPFVSLAQELSTYPANSIRLPGHMHLNVRGNRAVATAIQKNWALLTSPAPEPVPAPVAAR
jgi:hypothetical protein